MASLHCYARSPYQSIIGFHRPSCRAKIPTINLPNLGANTLSNPLYFRFKKALKLQVKQRLFPVFASNNNPPEGSDVSKTSDAAAQGPPFLTILAGLLLLFIIIWIIGSILMWLISLIVNVPPSK